MLATTFWWPPSFVIYAIEGAFIRYQNAQLQVFARQNTGEWYKINVEKILVNTWMYVVFTVTPGDGPRFYINGCDTGNQVIVEPAPGEVPIPLVLGNSKMDEIMYWYHVLEPMEIWSLYMQGGKVI